ncbi:MAG: NADH-quinone oxidoreductase subunit NuoG [Gammaproteobacteria bacterium]
MADIEIEIDGKTLTAKPNQMIIQVADEAGIYIPRFCYHKHLSIAANCRMCLVEVEKAPKALPACATPCMPGMKVFTRSEKTIAAQRAVMEFLLINHPLDCPVCDQGGECELQDLSMGYGSSQSHYDECKRSIPIQDLGPLIASEMTRCIDCSRCIRFGSEIAGMRELGMMNRGEHTEVTTFVAEAISSEVSGNIIDLCPVGALTNKPYRFTARTWELNQYPSIAPHDCLGSNLNIHTRYGQVMRVVARENDKINETWISDRDRYSYTGLYHDDRLKEPMAKINGEWQVVGWEEAFELAAAGLHALIAKHGADQLGALASPNATIEELYLFQRVARGLGTHHIDHRLRETDTSDQASMGAYPGFAMSLGELEQADAVLLIGSNLQKEQPLAALRLRKAINKGAKVAAINPMDYRFNFKVDAKAIVAPQKMSSTLAALANTFKQEFSDAHTNEQIQQIAEHLRGKQNICIILGNLALHHQEAASLRFLASRIVEATGAKLNIMTDGANAAGAWLAGVVPHRLAGGMPLNEAGLSANAMLQHARKGYLLLNIEPELDTANAAVAVKAMQQAELVVAFSMYRNESLQAHADIILPITPFTETSGTYVNGQGDWQSFKGVADSFGESRPAWKVLRVLANFLQLQGFDYESSEEVKHEMKAIVDNMAPIAMQLKQPAEWSLNAKESLTRIGELPIYALDSLLRRAQPLQEAQGLMEGDVAALRIHAETARKLGLADGGNAFVKQATGQASLPVMFDDRVAQDAVWIAGGIHATDSLGELFGTVEIERA